MLTINTNGMKEDNKENKTSRSQRPSSSGSDKNAQQGSGKKTAAKEFEKGSSGNSEKKTKAKKQVGDESDIDDESTI
jgi:hypothetical protein